MECELSCGVNCVLWSLRHSITTRLMEGTALLCSALHLCGLTLGSVCSFRGPQYRDRALRDDPEEATKMVKGLKGKLHEEQLESLGLFSLEEMRLRGDLIAVQSFLMRGRGGAGMSHLFSQVPSDRTPMNGLKLC